MNPKKAVRQFLSHIMAAPPGSNLEVGLTWDAKNGWRVYQRIGDKALAMAPGAARSLAETFDKVGARPEWKSAAAGLAGTLGELRPLADEADQKNRDKIVPPTFTAAGHA
jgi:hypothetical protein